MNADRTGIRSDLRRSLRAKFAISTACYLALYSVPALAQNDAQGTPAGQQEVAEAEDDGEIVITAERRSGILSRTPLSVSALTAEAIEERNVISEYDIQRTVPGVTVRATATSQGINFAIRGQNVEGFTSSPPAVQIYFNEVPIGGGGVSGFFDLASIQVLKGPQGTLFGGNSTGGAVLYTSVDPGPDFGGYLTFRAGNYDRLDIEGALNLPISDSIQLRVAGLVRDHDGYYYNSFFNNKMGDDHQIAARGTLKIDFGGGWENTTTVSYSRTRGTLVPLLLDSVYPLGSTFNGQPLNTTVALFFSPVLNNIIPGAWDAYLAAHPNADPGGILETLQIQKESGPWRTNLGPTSAAYRGKNFLISNITSIDLTDKIRFKNIFGYNNTASSNFTSSCCGPYVVLNNFMSTPQESFSNEAQVIGKAFGDKLDFIAGVFYTKKKLDNEQLQILFDLSPTIPPVSSLNINRVDMESIAGYFEGTLDLSSWVFDGLSFTAGIRETFDKVKLAPLPESPTYQQPGYTEPLKRDGQRTSWHFGLQYQATDSFMTYITSRRSFRSGGFNSNAPFINVTAAQGGAAFLDETATDIEVGAKFNGRVGGVPASLNVAAYNVWIDDIQRAQYAEISGITYAITVNVPKAKVSGFEVDGMIRPTPWLTLGGALSYTNARFTDDTTEFFGLLTVYGPFPDSPKWAGSVYAQVEVPLPGQIGELSLRGELSAQSKFYYNSTAGTLQPDTDIPGYHLLNLRAAIKGVGGTKARLAVNVTNVTNEEYYLGGVALGSILGANLRIPGVPRTVWAELTVPF